LIIAERAGSGWLGRRRAIEVFVWRTARVGAEAALTVAVPVRRRQGLELTPISPNDRTDTPNDQHKDDDGREDPNHDRESVHFRSLRGQPVPNADDMDNPWHANRPVVVNSVRS
jgi:hypothetical protein